jgi:hypothetical protein
MTNGYRCNGKGRRLLLDRNLVSLDKFSHYLVILMFTCVFFNGDILAVYNSTLRMRGEFSENAV